MSQKKVRGIVTEVKKHGENDKWLTSLCKDAGMISAKARGCRKPNSKLFACTSLFAYCDFIIDDHLRFTQVLSGDILYPFFAGCDDIDKISLGNFFLEVTNRFLKHGQEDNEFMYLLLKALQSIDKNGDSLKTAGCIFVLRAMSAAGFMPYLDACIGCGSEKAEFFHPEGLVCGSCVQKVRSVPVSPDTCKALVLIAETDINNVFKLDFDTNTQNELWKCAEIMLKHYAEAPLRTYEMLGKL
ncbi:MAG: DNA repair protein RecO [Firmicutes bacterium]|nr:DNA repair protein RecO [Bacillota bacterium]